MDCSQIHEIPEDQLLITLVDNPGYYLGNMGKKDLDSAKYVLANASTISPKLIKRYGLLPYKH